MYKKKRKEKNGVSPLRPCQQQVYYPLFRIPHDPACSPEIIYMPLKQKHTTYLYIIHLAGAEKWLHS